MSLEVPSSPARAAVLLIIAFIAIGACSHQDTVRSAPAPAALVDDSTALDNALARCNQTSASVEDPQCRSVRAALARLDAEGRKAGAHDERRAAEAAQIRFEQQREALRKRNDDERERLEQEQDKANPDPYTMPFVPPDAPVTGTTHQ